MVQDFLTVLIFIAMNHGAITIGKEIRGQPRDKSGKTPRVNPQRPQCAKDRQYDPNGRLP